MKWFHPKNNKRGQATTELAIMGAVVIMALAYLLQQGFFYNSRQALEMYTFRKALELSRSNQRGVNLTVMRDIISPSFFTGLNRQRLMATSSVEHNPYLLYTAYREDPEDIASWQLIQMGDAMISKGSFFQVPPTLVKIETEDNQDLDEGDRWNWVNSAVSEIDPQTLPAKITRRTSDYTYITNASENNLEKSITKTLETHDKIPTAVNFENPEDIITNYTNDDWEGQINSVEVEGATIPKNINLILEETIRREKSAATPQ